MTIIPPLFAILYNLLVLVSITLKLISILAAVISDGLAYSINYTAVRERTREEEEEEEKLYMTSEL